MVTDYHLQASNRQCCVTGRELKPGERYFGAVIDTDTAFIRRDYAEEAWNGPPEGAIGHWAGRVPAAGARVRPPIDDELLLDCLRRLDGTGEPSKLRFRYVVALLLMRRKRLRLEATEDDVLTFAEAKSAERHQVIDPGLTAGELSSVQDEVFHVLGWN